MNNSNSKTINISEEVTQFISKVHGHYIEGKWVESKNGKTSPVYNPATGEILSNVAEAGVKDTENAIVSAHKAFEDGRWKNMRPAEREKIIWTFSDLIEQNGEFLAQLETLEQGKSIGMSRAVEVGGSVDFIRYAAGLTTKITGQTLDVSNAFPGTQNTAFTLRSPIGVVAAIAPWNFPLSIAIWKITPALAAGCSVVLKPSEVTPLTALKIAELATEAGIPPGVLNVITGQGSVCGNALVTSPLISKITFTGSTATGKAIGRLAMDRLARVSLELGGKNPAIVLKDADLETAIGGLTAGAFFNQGQVCAAASRAYVEAPLFDKLAEGLSDAVNNMSVGPGMDPENQINPLVSNNHKNIVQSFLDEAISNNVELHQGQAGPDKNGYYVRPTLVLNPDNSIRLTQDEVFGPVLALTRVKDAEEAIKCANDSIYGLGASLWTQNLKSTMDIVPRIEAGTVWVNNHLPLDPNMPFGGYKQSGIGREFGTRWVEQFTEEKTVCITH